MAEAREPMGAHKKVHIRKITQIPTVSKRWQAKYGKAPTEEDVERMFQEFVPLQIECLSDYSALIPGTLDIVSQLRKSGYKIGSTTGFTEEMMGVLQKDAKDQGYVPDSTVCATQVPAGRPYPFMVLQNLINLQISPVEACVKIDDTIPGVEEGLNAGCWTIGLAISGNEVGLSLDDWKALPDDQQTVLRKKAYDRHIQSGAHYVVDSIQDIMPCIEDVERRLNRGERP
jgi:phosphonoacetaldehyde hydrolase